jgi:hypothetical protein
MKYFVHHQYHQSQSELTVCKWLRNLIISNKVVISHPRVGIAAPSMPNLTASSNHNYLACLKTPPLISERASSISTPLQSVIPRFI